MQVMLVWGLGFTHFFFLSALQARAAAGGGGEGGCSAETPAFHLLSRELK